MERRELAVESRTETGKGVARQLRAKGMIPGVVYGKGMDSIAVSLNPKELGEAIAGEGGRNNLLTLKGVESLDGKVVIVADLLKDPLNGSMMHVDLHKINMEEKIKVGVPINIVGTSKGVVAGGLLDFAKHTVEVECLPKDIPEHIDVDVTELLVGQSIHVGDIAAPAGVRILDDSRATVISILGRLKEETVASESEKEE
jgi:large subunit ribosomal protein L25